MPDVETACCALSLIGAAESYNAIPQSARGATHASDAASRYTSRAWRLPAALIDQASAAALPEAASGHQPTSESAERRLFLASLMKVSDCFGGLFAHLRPKTFGNASVRPKVASSAKPLSANRSGATIAPLFGRRWCRPPPRRFERFR